MWFEGPSSPLVSRCEIHLNTVIGMGGGISVDIQVQPVIRDCHIHDNTAGTGGGICSSAAGGVIEDCRVESNSCDFGGGVAFMSATGVVIRNTRIAENEALYFGGGLYASDSSFEITDCELELNYSQGTGGAMYLLNADVLVSASALRNNSADGATGGVFSDTSQFTAHTCEIEGNGTGLNLQGVSRAAADARYNWWGDSSGPYHADLNPNGLGDEIIGGAQFAPWNSAAGVDDWSTPIPTTWGAIKASHLRGRAL